MKKIIIFGGAAAALLAAVWFFVLPMIKGGGGHEAEHGAETEHAEAEETHAAAPAPPPKQQAPLPPAHDDEDEGVDLVSVKLPPFVINLPASTGARSPFFKCTLSIVLRDVEFGEVMKSDASYQFQKAQSIVLDSLNTLVANPDDLLANETREVFCDDLTDRLNEEIRRPKAGEGGGGGHGSEKKDKNAKPPPARPFKEVMILEWATQR